ncbi:MAG: DNA mismatch repair endonuclease MutL [Clostridiales bacterium]|nr:DNA mismatch repair endonuclease MutL [Clostridiales bacterium]MDD7432233.1 DNA mismatch repair endonuclease MutL [Clostridiales bacterium]MDY3062207.1 DNA mismatch repair endonuclease MutL [Eubacteriales bacterium]
MSLIHLLDPQTANGIAAGEVIERPASVVKELMENALDAGAGSIHCDIEQGGIRLIRVSDNGRGMSKEDVDLAFLPHATSKLSSLSDLEDLRSMGFRGEALASIAAVSRVRLCSREKEASAATEKRVEGGKLFPSQSCSSAVGTSVEVRDLFYNTPARFKFLKRDATEAAYIRDLVERLAFTRPDVSFRLVKDGQEQLMTPGDHQLNSVVYQVWGAASSAAMLEMDAAFGDILVRGLISRPDHSRKNRARQIFIVNGRVIQSSLLRAAVDQAIAGHFLKGSFPELVLIFDLPGREVDVNVHPQKSEVRFADERAIFSAAYHCIQGTLSEASGFTEAALSAEKAGPGEKAFREFPHAAGSGQSSQPSAGAAESTYPFSGEKAFSLAEPQQRQVNFLPQLQSQMNQPGENAHVNTGERLHPEEQAASFSALKPPEQPEVGFEDDPSEVSRLLRARLIGQVFNTYLLLEEGDDFLLIDQHAAHERILYEKLLRHQEDSRGKKNPSQPLLTPLQIRTSALEREALLDRKDEIERMGFDFEPFSDSSFVLRAVPQSLGREPVIQAEAAFRTIIELALDPNFDFSRQEAELMHSMACKAAVKAHDILSYDEMCELLKQLQGLRDPYHCPHGRPVILRLSRKDIEKMFRRIV